jgi:hypothetical protein
MNEKALKNDLLEVVVENVVENDDFLEVVVEQIFEKMQVVSQTEQQCLRWCLKKWRRL